MALMILSFYIQLDGR